MIITPAWMLEAIIQIKSDPELQKHAADKNWSKYNNRKIQIITPLKEKWEADGREMITTDSPLINNVKKETV